LSHSGILLNLKQYVLYRRPCAASGL
jgi:hypothetical protein